MTISDFIAVICSMMFFMIGFDKFYAFVEPPCTLMDRISPTIWQAFGFMQVSAGILIWFPQLRRYVAGFFTLFMAFFTVYHLSVGTTDVAGSIFMGVLLGLLAWNPQFINGRKKNSNT